MALFFGLQERGETVKTSEYSANQGTIIDNLWVAELVIALMHRRAPGEKLFRITREQVWGRIQFACGRLGIECSSWNMHRARHTGAALDYLEEKRNLEQIQRRGRWLSINSVQRYTKIAQLLQDLADLSSAVRRKGEEFIADPKRFIRFPAAKSAHFA